MKPLPIAPGLVLCALWTAAAAQQVEPKTTKPAKAPSQEKREQALARLLSGAVFEGQYTVEDARGRRTGQDRYTIEQAKKLRGNYWLLVVRIQYDGKDVKVPLTLPVLWAGQTPVITLDKLPVPGLGTFSARVVIHGDRYAGTWDAGDHGGHLWGRIRRAEKRPEQSTP